MRLICRDGTVPEEFNIQNTENRLLLLYLIDEMDLPLSRSQITEHVRQSEYMDYYTLQQTLAGMVDSGYLEQTQDNNTTRYSVTEEGHTMLEYFKTHIPSSFRTKIDNYVRDHRRNIMKEFENTATYFPNEANNEFTIKCGVYEDRRVLMELFITVDTREQAKLIQTNWKTNAKVLYGRIMGELVSAQE
jgi:Fe2+ or Zn2+ uptake regulation protein